jgi:hypothetical protein
MILQGGCWAGAGGGRKGRRHANKERTNVGLIILIFH